MVESKMFSLASAAMVVTACGVLMLAVVWPGVAAIAVIGAALWLAVSDGNGVTATATHIAIERSRTLIGDLGLPRKA